MRHSLLLPLLCATALSLSACVPPSDVNPSAANASEQERNLQQLAEGAKKNGDMAAALSFYSQMADHSTQNVAAHLALAEMNRSMGRARDSTPTLRKALALQPQNPRVMTELGFALIDENNAGEALALFDAAIVASPSASAFNGRGIALNHLQRHAEAHTAYKEALQRSPGNPRITSNMALSHTFAGEYDSAIQMLEPLIATDAANATMRQNLALAYGLKGNREQALAMNLRDLPPEKAQENLDFYKHYHSVGTTAIPTATFQAVPVEPVIETPQTVAQDTPVAPPLPPELPAVESAIGKPAIEPPPVVAAKAEKPEKLEVKIVPVEDPAQPEVTAQLAETQGAAEDEAAATAVVVQEPVVATVEIPAASEESREVAEETEEATEEAPPALTEQAEKAPPAENEDTLVTAEDELTPAEIRDLIGEVSEDLSPSPAL